MKKKGRNSHRLGLRCDGNDVELMGIKKNFGACSMDENVRVAAREGGGEQWLK